MRLLAPAFCCCVLAFPAAAEELLVTVEVPQLDVAEYHRPYVAMWLENAEGAATNLSVWYTVAKKNDEGETWLKDLRQWWRRTGRETDFPVDGVSAPTRPVGDHQLTFDGAQLENLKPGDYEFVIEAAREGGGRELLRTPIKLPASAEQTLTLAGESELGDVTITLKP